MKKPSDIVYGVDDKVPVASSVLLALQQLFIACVYLFLVAFLINLAHLPIQLGNYLISASLVAMGLGTALQAWRGRWLGSGYLAGYCVAVTYFSASVMAVRAGGLPLLLGMTIFGGAVEMLFSGTLKHLRHYFPPVVCGLTFCGLGLDVGLMSIGHVVSHQSVADHHFQLNILCFAVTLVLAIGLSVWGRGMLKLLCIVVAVVIGAVLAYMLQQFSPQNLLHIHQSAWLYLPLPSHWQLAFSWQLAPIFAIAAIAAGLRTMGCMTTCQQINDADWQRPEHGSIRRGVLVDGLVVLLSGLFGTVAVGVSPSAIGVSKTSGATSRWIAVPFLVMSVLFALSPKFSALILAMPKSVISAGLIVTSCTMLVGGMRIISSQPLNLRNTYIIGIALLVGLSGQFFKTFFDELPMLVHSIFDSMLASVTLTAVLLNAIFMIQASVRSHYRGLAASMTEMQLQHQLDALRLSEKRQVQVAKHLHAFLESLQTYMTHDEVAWSVTQKGKVLLVSLEYTGRYPLLPNIDATEHTDNLVEEKLATTGVRNFFSGDWGIQDLQCKQLKQGKMQLSWKLS